MNYLEQLNVAASSLFPYWIWDILEVGLGSIVAMFCFLQRLWSPRYSLRHVEDSIDTALKRLGQFGLVVWFTCAILIVFDGMSEGYSPPRSLTCALFLGIAFIQARDLRVSYHLRRKSPKTMSFFETSR